MLKRNDVGIPSASRDVQGCKRFVVQKGQRSLPPLFSVVAGVCTETVGKYPTSQSGYPSEVGSVSLAGVPQPFQGPKSQGSNKTWKKMKYITYIE